MDATWKTGFSVSAAGGSDAYNRFQSRLSVAERGRPMGSRDDVAPPRPLRVLIVDNDSDAADTLGELVRLWGHDAWRTYGGATGLATAAATRPDVVLLDIAMPGMDGCQLAAQLRQGAGLKDCFLIALTGWGDEKNRRRCQEAGIDLFLVKPVETFVIQTLLALERRRLQLSRPVATIVEAESKQNGAAPEAVLA